MSGVFIKNLNCLKMLILISRTVILRSSMSNLEYVSVCTPLMSPIHERLCYVIFTSTKQ